MDETEWSEIGQQLVYSFFGLDKSYQDAPYTLALALLASFPEVPTVRTHCFSR